MRAFKLRGKTIAGFAAFKKPSQLPAAQRIGHSQLAKETERYTSTNGSLHFPIDKPLARTLVKKLMAVRIKPGINVEHSATSAEPEMPDWVRA
jgi:uncharacterized protein YdhG (YjbR/CyaY superfamily)